MFTFLFPLYADNVVRASTVIRGEVSFKGSVKILGQVDGALSVRPNDRVVVKRKGVLRSENVVVDTLIVEGAVYATAIKARRLVVRHGGEVHGRIEAQSLVVHSSARYDGHVTLCEAPVDLPETSPAKIAKQRLEGLIRT